MVKFSGSLRKMATSLADTVQYQMVVDEQHIDLNQYLGHAITLETTGKIFCIQCGRSTNKSFQQGYCFPCLKRLQECNLCILHPERCQVEHGTCPEDDWAHAQCHQQHIVYLANSSALKVGITRHTQVPTRWMDQGAMQAMPIFTVANRYQSGVIEVALKQFVSDKTNWRTMLKQDATPIDLIEARDQLLAQAEQVLDTAKSELREGDVEFIEQPEPIKIQYPIEQYPVKITSLSLEKTPQVSGILQGIKGQYLLLDTGVINIRKFGGYQINGTIT